MALKKITLITRENREISISVPTDVYDELKRLDAELVKMTGKEPHTGHWAIYAIWEDMYYYRTGQHPEGQKRLLTYQQYKKLIQFKNAGMCDEFTTLRL